MPTSSSATLLVSRDVDILPESDVALRPAIPPVALSARARERLRVLNEVLAASVPPPADDQYSASEAAIGE